MGFLDSVRALVQGTPYAQPTAVSPFFTYSTLSRERVSGLTIDELWRTQPYLRTLVTFLARNVAQLGLQSFQRVTETDRQRLRADPLPLLIPRPIPTKITYELIFDLVADLALYDEAIWWVRVDSEAPSGWNLTALSPSWITARAGGDVFHPDWIEFQVPAINVPVRIPFEQLLWFHGWNPGRPNSSSSPVDALRDILAEQIASSIYRRQMWERGGRIGGYLSRPSGAKWDAKTRKSFQRQWQELYAGNDAPKAGGTPILEDGMTYTRAGFNAHDEEFVDAAKLSFATVSSVYHVNPTMVGLLDNANFSNVREFRKMLYGDTLGSTISMIEDRINTFLVPLVSSTPDAYVEFNISEKLRGNFEEQAAALSTAVGRPWMTADEARGLNNMRSLGGDAETLVTPLNVLVGGQASPTDSGTQNVGPKSRQLPATKAEPSALLKSTAIPGAEGWRKQSEAVLARFFKRQAAVVLSALGAKAADPDWWDGERWDNELAADLYKLAVTAATDMGRAQAKALGFEADDYDEARTLNFLKAVAKSRASAVNATTRQAVQTALDADEEPTPVFDDAKDNRAHTAGWALGAALAGFATVEAASQLVGDSAQKRWDVNSSNPRPSHADMNGETVGLHEKFSNGADWPGDPVLGAEGVANCTCGVTVTT